MACATVVRNCEHPPLLLSRTSKLGLPGNMQLEMYNVRIEPNQRPRRITLHTARVRPDTGLFIVIKM